jgi:hypothetical protein
MKIILGLIAIVLLASCAAPNKCYPSKGSKDYARKVWYKQLSDGYWQFEVINGFKDRKSYRFECFPDDSVIAKL